jgi:hypothetical protein
MKGLYLYCLRERTENPEPIGVPGIDGSNTVRLFPFRALDAVVSEVPLDEFASEEIQKRAREDIDWIKEKSLAHQSVITESSHVSGRTVCVIPMRFGAIYKSSANLEQALTDSYASLCGLLEELRGKQEWSVKIYLTDPNALDAAVCQANESILQRKEEMAGLPEGLAFFMEQELEEAIGRERKREIQRLREETFLSLAGVTSDARAMEVLGKELTGRNAPMVFNAACLVEGNALAGFRDAVAGQKEALRPKGLSLECTGPLPPFSFSSLEKKNEHTS